MKNTVLFITPSPIVTRWSPRGRGPPARCPRACAGTSCPSPDFFLTTHQKGDQVQKGDQHKNWTKICFKQNEILMFGLKKTGLKKRARSRCGWVCVCWACCSALRPACQSASRDSAAIPLARPRESWPRLHSAGHNPRDGCAFAGRPSIHQCLCPRLCAGGAPQDTIRTLSHPLCTSLGFVFNR